MCIRAYFRSLAGCMGWVFGFLFLCFLSYCLKENLDPRKRIESWSTFFFTERYIDGMFPIIFDDVRTKYIFPLYIVYIQQRASVFTTCVQDSSLYLPIIDQAAVVAAAAGIFGPEYKNPSCSDGRPHKHSDWHLIYLTDVTVLFLFSSSRAA